MFSNSPLYALAKNNEKDFCVYKLAVSSNALTHIRKNFEEGFELIKSMDPHDFSPTYKLDQDECAKMDNFAIPDEILDAIRNSANLEIITEKEFKSKKIKALFMGTYEESSRQEQFSAVFKRFYSVNCLSHNWFNLLLGKNQYDTLKSEVLTIPETSHAVFEKGTLYFSSYKIANEIFYLTDRYRSATNKDLEDFSNYIKFDESKYTLEGFATTKIRKLIAQINDSKILEDFEKTNLLGEAKKQDNVPLTYTNDGKILLNLGDKKEVILVLDFLAENTFMSTFRHRRNRTNSKEEV